MKYLFLFLITYNLSVTKAQSIKGTVTDANTKEALQGATLFWKNSQQGTVADSKGLFEIAYPDKTPAILIISYIGYISESVAFNNQTELHLKLKPSATLNEVQISETKESLAFSTIDPMNRQTLNAKELTKAACCNLSESFETNATVDVTYNDALSGTKQIKILGLDGAYTQTLIEQQGGIRGLSTNVGFSHIPGSWAHSIDITKGVGSVINGYESISGQINIELLKPEKTDQLHINLYAGDYGRYESNIHLGHRLNKEWSTLLLTHASTVSQKNDFNKDGFMDVATGYQLGAINKWKYEKTGKIMASFGVIANLDNRTGGQMNYNNRAENDLKQVYGVGIQTKHLEAYSKTAFGFKGRPYKSINLLVNARNYSHNAFYGFKQYNGAEQTINVTAYYQTIINSSNHKIKLGGSYLLDNFNETYRVNVTDSNFKRTESVPGIFAEYHYEIFNKLSVLLGARTDFHNLYGLMFNPRAHVKFNITQSSALRFSAGKGTRGANVFVEQPFIMASNRTVIIRESFKPEVAWNYGISLTHKFKIVQKNAALVLDFYRTDFQNQIVTDLDQNVQEINIYNLKGQSFSNSFQTEFNVEVIKKLEIRLAYKWQDVRTTYNGKLLQKPLIAKNRVLFNIGYATAFDKWKFDATVKWTDKNRIPNTQTNPVDLQFNSFSKTYYTMNTQVTKAFKRFEIYVGAENIFNFIQQQQIIDPANPFGQYFDASLIWGPIMGRVLYAGFRMSIK